MKIINYAAAILFLIITSCKKEMTGKQRISTSTNDEATANNIVQFNGDAFYGGYGYTYPNKWADAYTDYLHLPYPRGCKLTYARFKINHQAGAIIDSMRLDIAGTMKVRRNLSGKPAGNTVIFQYYTPKAFAG